jgi:glycogen operon protein
MTDEDWQSGFARTLMVFLNGDGIREPDERGERVVDDSFLLLFNAFWEPLEFTMPAPEFGASWETVLDTAAAAPRPALLPERVFKPGNPLEVEARSIVVLRRLL